MTTVLRALAAVTLRNLRLARRRRDLLLQSMAVPAVVLCLASIIFGASDAWPIALVDQSHTGASHEVITAISQTRGATGPYFRVIETDPHQAADDLHRGRLQLVITLPADFDQTRHVDLATYNINTDAMKNVRMRFTTAANLADQAHQTAHPGPGYHLDKVHPHDITRNAFMGGSAVILALLLGAALTAANLYAVDNEHRTEKELALSPLGAHLAGLGAALAGWLLSVVVALPTLVIAVLFGLRATPAHIAQAALIVLPADAAAAGLGVCAAVALRTHRLIQPPLILLALGTYFASGGFISVSALPPIARTLDTVWLPSYIFEWSNPLLHGFRSTAQPSIVITVTVSALIALAADALATRTRRTTPTHGQ